MFYIYLFKFLDLEFARVFFIQKQLRPMAGGVFMRKAVQASVSFEVHFSLKAGFVLGVFDIAFTGDDVSLFGLKKGADVMNGFAVVVILTRQRLFVLLS